jgi:hypothetical protein
MSIIAAFAGRYSARDFGYGGSQGGPALIIGTGNGSAGVGTITIVSSQSVTTGGIQTNPITTNTPITVGIGANAETVTPTAVSQTQGVAPGNFSINVTATFSNVHGAGEPVNSGTNGLQEAINFAAANGGGIAVVTAGWYASGGTVAIIQAATVPPSGVVIIEDVSVSPTVYWAQQVNNTTVVSAPSAATSATVASQVGVVGTWTATTEHVLFTYVTADGGETVASADYSFSATASLAIGGTGPAASAGAVGYKVYIGTNATTSCFQVPAIAANGTVIQCGPIAAFKIGTPFSVAAATTSAGNLIPVQNTAFPVGLQPTAASNMATPFAAVSGPFSATGSVTSTVTEMARLALPVGFLNQVTRTMRLSYWGSWTPAGTAKLILTVSVYSKYTGTATTIFTVTTAASSGAAIANFKLELILVTATTGATGTIEAHGVLVYSGATATPEVAIATVDAVQAASSAIDLTKQDYVTLGISSDATITTSQCRIQEAEVLI